MFKKRLPTNAQTMLEYLLLMTMVAFLVFTSFKQNGILDLTRQSTNAYFSSGSRAILGGYYSPTTKKPVFENPAKVDGGWCPWSDCFNNMQTRECACPRPAFGGDECSGDALQSGCGGPSVQTCRAGSGLVYVPGSGCVCPSGFDWTGDPDTGSCVPCISDPATCDATPGCQETAQGVDNCGRTCTKTGPPCGFTPVNGGWTAWSACTGSCPNGTQTRSCTNPPPANGGANCTGASSQSCSLSPCCGDGNCDAPGETCLSCVPDCACVAPQTCNAAGVCTCSTNCNGKMCGSPDGCSGTCQPGSGCCSTLLCNGTCCSAGQTCYNNACCTAQCSGKACGASDGCGGTCAAGSGCCSTTLCNGTCCSAGQTCYNNACCTTSCSGKICGAADGCGGTCAPGSGCCTPTCGGKMCGASDGCGGTCAVGSGCCSTTLCNGACCSAGQTCYNNACCSPSCAGKNCGGNNCGGVCGVGVCPWPSTCNNGVCCTPSCTGRPCGTDYCGGTCGTCPWPQVCDAFGQCVGSPCLGTVPANGQVCTLTTNGSWYTFVPFCSGQPCTYRCSYTYCNGSCCGFGASCYNGSCCTPNCAGKNCGSNGCGGSCGTGTCPYLQHCSASGTCTPDSCSGWTFSHCGGSCGGFPGICSSIQHCAYGSCFNGTSSYTGYDCAWDPGCVCMSAGGSYPGDGFCHCPSGALKPCSWAGCAGIPPC